MEEANRQARARRWREKAERYWKGEDGREKLERVGVNEFDRQKIFDFVCVCVCACLGDREISLQEQVCPLALLHSIWGNCIHLGKHAHRLPLSTALCLTPSSFAPSRWTLSVLTAPLPYVSAETKVPLRGFSYSIFLQSHSMPMVAAPTQLTGSPYLPQVR